MRIFIQKKIYLPALSILAVVFLLFILIGVSTVRNLHRQKQHALGSLHRQAEMLLRTLEAGARYGFSMMETKEDSLGTLISETGKSREIAYIYLFGASGRITHHTDAALDGTPAPWTPRFQRDDQIKTRITTTPEHGQIYEISKRFVPWATAQEKSQPLAATARTPHSHSGEVVVVGLEMTRYTEARRADTHHALLMTGILAILGSGIIFFIFVIQNYYLVDKTLTQTRDYTRQIITSMGNGLLSVDPGQKIVAMNPAAGKILKLPPGQEKHLSLSDLKGFENLDLATALTNAGHIPETEIRYRTGSGEIVPLGVGISPIKGGEGQRTGAVLELRNLGEIKRLESEVRRAEKLAAIGRLAAGVAHEIRNPLSSIKGFAQFLRHGLQDRPKDKEYADIMVREIDRINKVINDLLAFARPVSPKRESTDMAELMGHVIRLVEVEADTRGIIIDVDFTGPLTDLRLDASLLIQVLLNLLLNALKAVEKDGRIEISVRKDDTKLYISIQDNGVGIAPEHMDRLFDPFFTTRDDGTGLGLAIVEKIVQSHGGDVAIVSPVPGQKRGCRVTVKIPV